MTLHDPLHLATTQAFIDENPTTLAPLRRTRTANGTGGFTIGAGVAQAPVTIRKVGLNSVTGVQERTTPDGKAVLVTSNVIAMPDAGLLVDDVLSFNDGNYVVLSVSFDPPWRLRAEVYKRG